MTVLPSNPGFLPALLLGVLPLLAHLYARARPRVRDFPTTRFLAEVVRNHRRVERPRDWLLLVLRTLLILALVGTFLRPVYYGGEAGAASTAARDVVLLVDQSASMNAPDGPGTRFDRATAAASELLGGLGAGDRANIVWMRASPQAASPEFSTNAAFLIAGLSEAAPTLESSHPEAALGLALELLAKAEGTPELVIFSDFQRNVWSDLGWSAPENLSTFTFPVATGDVDNLALRDLRIEPRRPVVGETAQVYASVASFGKAGMNSTVYLEAGGYRDQQAVNLIPGGEQTVVFEVPVTEGGDLLLSASLDADAFPADNRRWIEVEVRSHLAVQAVIDDPAIRAVWEAALNAFPQVKTRWNGDGSGDLLLIAAPRDFPSAEWDQLRADSGAVIVQPVEGLRLPGMQTPARWEPFDEPVSLRVEKPGDPLLEPFAAGAYGDPGRILTKGRWSPGLPNEPLLTYPGGETALGRITDGNSTPVFLWNIPVSPSRSNLAATAEFIPLFGEILRRAAAAATAPAARFVPGMPLLLELPAIDDAEGIVLRSPGTTSPSATTRDDLALRWTENGLEIRTPPVDQTGVHIWEQDNEVLARSIVDFPPTESDLRRIDPNLNARSGALLDSTEAYRRRTEGVELWPWLLAAAVVCAIGEASIAWKGRLA